MRMFRTQPKNFTSLLLPTHLHIRLCDLCCHLPTLHLNALNLSGTGNVQSSSALKELHDPLTTGNGTQNLPSLQDAGMQAHKQYACRRCCKRAFILRFLALPAPLRQTNPFTEGHTATS